MVDAVEPESSTFGDAFWPDHTDSNWFTLNSALR